MVNGGFHVEFLCIPLFNASKLPQQIESRWWCPKGHPQKPCLFYQFQERYLVGGWPSPLKNDGVNVSWDICWDDDMSNWMEKTCSKPPTSYIWSQTGPEVTENLYQTCSSGGFSGLRWITYFGIWSSQMDPNGCRMTACDFSWISPHVLQQGNLGIISSRSAYWSYFASQISQLDLGSCLISGKPCSITFKSFDFVFGVHHTGFRRMCDTKPTRPLQKVQHLEARASLQVKLQLMNMAPPK